MSEDIKKIAKVLQAAAPLPYAMLIDHLTELEATADSYMVSAIEDYLLRQNQGKVQLLRELLKDLNI